MVAPLLFVVATNKFEDNFRSNNTMSRTTLWGMVVVVVNLFLFPTTIVRQVRAFGLDKATSRSLPPQQLQHLQQSLSTYVETNNNEDDEENKWERLYAQGQSVPKNTNNAASSPSPIRVVSFDLGTWSTPQHRNRVCTIVSCLPAPSYPHIYTHFINYHIHAH